MTNGTPIDLDIGRGYSKGASGPPSAYRAWDVSIAPMASPQLIAQLEQDWEPICAIVGVIGTDPSGQQVMGPIIVLRKKNSPIMKPVL